MSESDDLVQRLKRWTAHGHTILLCPGADSTQFVDSLSDLKSPWDVTQAYDQLLALLRDEPGQFPDELLAQCVSLGDFRYIENTYYPPAQLDERRDVTISFEALRELAKARLAQRRR